MNEAILDVFRKGLLSGDDVAGKRVIEVGSYDVNGSVRPVIESLGPRSYLGVDIAPGPGVDEIVDCTDLIETFGEASFGVVVTTEMLEHVSDWKTCVANLAGITADDGLLVITTRSPGFPRHDYPADYWRYTPKVLGALLEAIGFELLDCFPDPDLQSPGVIAKARKSGGQDFAHYVDSLGSCEMQPEPMDAS